MAPAPPTTLLLVEDSDLIATFERAALEAAGYRVHVAISGQQAIDYIHTVSEINLVLMDINLGNGLTGVEAARAILAVRNLPLIFLSGHSEPELVSLTKDIPSYGYVVKKSNTAVLKAQIEMALGVFRANERARVAEEKARKLLAERDLILKETHHRVKNNFNTIVGLLVMQADQVASSEAKAALETVSSRVFSMAHLYEKLYRSDVYSEVDSQDYLPTLVDEIVGNFASSALVTVTKDIGAFVLPVDKVQPLGILLNEVLTNAMKYAFAGRSQGRLHVSAQVSGRSVTLVVEDDGVGVPNAVDLEHSTGFGMTLVRMLTKQLGGTIRLERGAGTRFVLDVPTS